MRIRLSAAILYPLFSILACAALRAATPQDVRVDSVTHKPLGPVSAIDLSTTTVTFADAQIPQAKVSGLTTSLSSEASTRAAADAAITSTLSANDAAAVHKTGNETVAGTKTFSAAPAVPDNSFTESKVASLVSDLAAINSSISTNSSAITANDSAAVHKTGNETIAGTKTFSSAPSVPSGAFPESAVANLTSDLAAKATDSATLHLAGAENVTGAKTFVPLQTFNAIATSNITATQLANAGAPTVTPIGASGVSTWAYKIVAKLSDGTPAAAGPAGATTAGDDVLDSTNKNSLTWTAVPGAASYDVYRTAHGITPSTTGKIANVTTNSYVDAGASGDSGTAPVINNTGGFNGVLLNPKSTSARVVYASKSGCALDSNVDVGGGTNDTDALQALLDTVTTQGPTEIDIDGVARISRPLVVHSNTRIRVLPNGGVFMDANSDSIAMLTTDLAGGTRYQNKNIEIIGGVWNGNANNQGDRRESASPNAIKVGFWLGWVDGLVVRDVMIRNAKTFALQISQSRNIFIQNLNCFWDDGEAQHADNRDGIHLLGPIDNIHVDTLFSNGDDDVIAFNTNEITSLTNTDTRRGTTLGTAPITNALVENVYFKNSAAGLRFYGVTYYEGVKGYLDNIVVRNVFGNIIGPYPSHCDNVTMGRVAIDGWHVTSNTPGNNGLVLNSTGRLRLNDLDYNVPVALTDVTSTTGDWFLPPVRVAAAVNFGTIAAQATSYVDLLISGALVGDIVEIGVPAAGGLPLGSGTFLHGACLQDGVVRVRASNFSSAPIASTTGTISVALYNQHTKMGDWTVAPSSATASVNFGTIAASSTGFVNITVPGAKPGDAVAIGLPVPAGLPLGTGLLINGICLANDTVTLRAGNVTSSAAVTSSGTVSVPVTAYRSKSGNFASVTVNFGTIAPQSSSLLNVSVPGVKAGDVILTAEASPGATTGTDTGTIINAVCLADDLVTMRCTNITGSPIATFAQIVNLIDRRQ